MATRVDFQLSIKDPLGRWSGHGYRGRNGAGLIALVAYRPVHNERGSGSVWSQQYAHYANQGRAEDPMERFDRDLQALIRRLLEKNYHLVLGIDANDNLAKPQSAFRSKMESVGLEETILQQHGEGPPTMNRGSTKIDGLFVSAALRGLKCGYTGWIADHTGLFVDVPMHVALGHAIPPILRPSMRRLKLQDPRVVAAYLAAYKASLEKEQIIPKMEELWQSASGRYDPYATENSLSTWEQAEYECLDEICTRAMLVAERGCRKLFLGAVPWSPAFMELQQYHHLVVLLIRRRQGLEVSAKTLERLAVIGGKQSILGWSHSCLKRELQRLKLEIKDFKEHRALEARRTHNERLVLSIAETTGMEATKVLQALMKREEMRTNARIIRAALKSSFSGAVAMVQSTNEAGELVTWTGKEDMEAAIMKECQARFRQASSTDFLQPPLYSKVGALGVSPLCDPILTGQVSSNDLEGSSVYANKLIAQLERPANLQGQFCNPIPDLEAFQRGWRIQQERTGSYPGRHFGHMMANAQDPLVAELHRQLEYLPMLTGQPPPSWFKAIDVMIKKKAGNFEVGKLRAICLFDSVANHCFKYLGKSMMWQAEEEQLLAKEQGGSRRGHRANYIGLEKRLSFEMSRMLRLPMALCSNDARACYDRIVHSVASMSCQRVGAPKPAVICMFTTIQKLQHHIRTIFGDSETYFGGDEDKHLHAVPVSTIGQGNGAGPQIWAVVSTPVLNMLRAEGLCMSYKGAITGKDASFVGYSFVDDTDLGICASHLTEPAQVVEKMQHSLDHWEGGLRATGGAIAPEKTFWYLLTYQWHSDGSWSMLPEDKCEANLTVRDMHGTVQQITRHSNSHSERTLGIYLSPDGSETCQEEVLRDKSKAWAKRLRGSRLPRHLATVAYTTTIDKSFSYPLVATCLTEKQCSNIQGPAMTAALQLSGIGRDVPLVVRTGPVKYQGLGLPDMFTTQLYHHIEALAFAAENPSRNTSQLLQVNGEQLKLELGVNGPLFGADMTRVSSTTQCWMKFTGKGCKDQSIQVLDNIPDFSPHRQGDQLLMEIFRASNASPTMLGILNRCRLFLQVVYLSDIVTADGLQITIQAWEGRLDSSRESPYNWPVQGKLSAYCWTVWREALQQHWCGPTRQLHHSLGLWHEEEPTTRFFYSPSYNRLVERTRSGWFQYVSSSSGCTRRVRAFKKVMWSYALPKDLQRASVDIRSPIDVRLNGCGKSIGELVAAPTSILASMRQLLPEPTRWILDYVSLPDDKGLTIAEAIRSGKAMAVSDGSFDPHLLTGAAATTLQGVNATNAIFAQCVSPGQKEDQSAYRSELIGVYQTLVIAHLLCRLYDIQSGCLEFACDGLAVLKQASKVQSPTPLSQGHFDIISACRRIMRETPITWRTRHVLGHQRERGGFDKTRLIGPLDRWAKLNDDMDEAAKLHRIRFADPLTAVMPQFLYCEISPICIQGIKLCRNVQAALREQVNGKPLLQYWKSKGKFGDLTAGDVDWSANYKAMKALPLGRRHHQAKIISKFVAVRYRMKLRKQSKEDTCPTCLSQPIPTPITETVDHLYKCPSTKPLWSEKIEELDEYLCFWGTKGSLRRAIVANLKAWRLDLPPTVSPDAPTQVLVDQQTLLGWHAAFEGRFAIGWAAAQERYFRLSNSGPHHNGRRWLSMLIQKLFDISWDLWSHRNDALHKRETGIRIQDLQRQVAAEFATGHTGIRRLRLLMQPGLARIKRRPAPQLEEWLYQITTERTLRQQQTPEETEGRRQRSFMQRHFRLSLPTIPEHA